MGTHDDKKPISEYKQEYIERSKKMEEGVGEKLALKKSHFALGHDEVHD